ncbi:hypothetical protein GCM10029963_69800 [Micromonospora andamanensis]
MTMAVPYFDYPTRYAGWTEDVLDAVREVGESDEFILKSRVAALETAVARRTGAAEAIAVASGTGALTVILTAMDIGPGDDVVTPAFSFISSASTVALRGARPVFADVDYDTAMLTVATVEAVRTTASRAVVPAYLFASSPDMPALRALADRHSMRLIEDSAVALGGQVAGRPAGRHGDAGVYSFFPGKPLGGIGDAGMIVTDDPELATTCRMLRNHGQDLNVRFLHHLVGFNSRMDEVTALFLLRRLPHLDQFLAERRRLARQYGALLREAAPVVLTPPGTSPGSPSTPTSYARHSATTSAPTWPDAVSRRRSTIPGRCTCNPRSDTSATARVTSRSPSACPASAWRCRCIRNCPPEPSSGSSRRSPASTGRAHDGGGDLGRPGLRHR